MARTDNTPKSVLVYPERQEGLQPAGGVSLRLANFLKRIQALPRGHSYAITLWVPDDCKSEPVWSISNLGRIENDR